MYYYIYKITLTKGKFKNHYYIGQHKTDNMDDGYKGSGILVNKYYKKYPNDFIKEILCYCKDKDELNKAEDFYVGDLYKTDPLCLNLIAGGKCKGISEETRLKQSISAKNRNPNFLGHKHNNETKKKMSDKKIGNKNSIGHNVSEQNKEKYKQLFTGKHWKKDEITGKRIWY